MAYAHQGRRNILIWDGLDSGITEKSYKTVCPCCKNAVAYKVRDMVDVVSLDHDFLESLVESKIISKMQGRFEVKKGIPAYTIKHICSNCKKGLWIVVGLKEVQPQRYKIFYKSVVYEIIKSIK